MPLPTDYSFIRFLAAKRSVDDRALNAGVRAALAQALRRRDQGEKLTVLEIGAGTGTMIERTLEDRLLCHAEYTALDLYVDNIIEARRRLLFWAQSRDYHFDTRADGTISIDGFGQSLLVRFEIADLFDFIRTAAGRCRWDLLIAHAFLDLIDIPSALPRVFSLAQPGGLFYFTLIFDGDTILEPVLDPAFDAEITRLYHQTMDERCIDGRPSGDSRSGRRMFQHLYQAGAAIHAAGASDWVVYPQAGAYSADEAYFLHFIIHTIDGALQDRPELDAARFKRWIEARHAQVERSELVYIAHQLDFTGAVPQSGYCPSTGA